MIKIVVLAGMLAFSQTALAPPVPLEFACSDINPEAPLQQYAAIEFATPSAPAAVELRKAALLFERLDYPRAAARVLADPALAAEKPGWPPTRFTPHRFGAVTRYCAQTARQDLFGDPGPDNHFLLRCLIDGDGDGSYEQFVPQVKLIRADRYGKPVGAEPTDPLPQPLAHPLRLVETDAPPPPGGFPLRAARRIKVHRIKGNQLELSFSRSVSVAALDFLAAGRGEGVAIVSIPMTDGREVAMQGTRIRFDKSGGKWFATVLDEWGPPPELLCGGSVVRLGNNYTILGAGMQYTVAPR